MLPFFTAFLTVKPFTFPSELPSGASHVTTGVTARYWTTWTVQVREYDCPVIAKVEAVNWTFGRGRAVGENHASQFSYVYSIAASNVICKLGGYKLLSSTFCDLM